MTKFDEAIAKEKAGREHFQAEIVKKWGRREVANARAGLCRVCVGFCRGLGMPLTMEGKDCEYFEHRERRELK